MNIRAFAIASAIGACASGSYAAVISSWSFDNRSSTADTGSGVAAGVQTSVRATQTGVFAQSNTNRSVANGALQVTNFDRVSTRSGNDGLMFTTSTTDFAGISIEFFQMVGSRASKWAQLQYSFDGGQTFTSAGLENDGRYQVAKSGTYQGVSFNLSEIDAANDQGNFQFRVMAVHGEGVGQFETTSGRRYTSTGSKGAWNFDQVTVTGEQIPTSGTSIPSGPTLAILGIGGILIPTTRRRAH